jgi:hypothetical protein
MIAPLDLVESNRTSPHDSFLLTQKLHWIRQVGIERRDIINDNVSGRLQTFLQLRDVEHIMHTYQGWQQLQSVCHIPQLSQDKKQTDVTWCQPAFDPKPLHISRR